MHDGGTGYPPLTRTPPGGNGRKHRPQRSSVEEAEDATTMVLIGLFCPESFGRARRIERLHRPADLETVFEAAGLRVAHVGNASFRVATVCTGHTPSPRGL